MIACAVGEVAVLDWDWLAQIPKSWSPGRYLFTEGAMGVIMEWRPVEVDFDNRTVTARRVT